MLAITGQFDVLGVLSRDPHRAERFLERCTNAVASPFGVKGAKSVVN